MTIIETKYDWAYSPGLRAKTGLLIIHHIAAESATPQDIHSWHLTNGWAGIAYHYYVRKDGQIYRGRPENWLGAHTVGHNDDSIGICFEGNFELERMGEAQIKAGAALARDIVSRYPGVAPGAHRDFNATACPGKNFPWNNIINVEEDEDMDSNKFNKLMDEYLAELSRRDGDEWSDEARAWAEREGLLVGDGDGRMAYKRFLTREEFAVVAHRAAMKLSAGGFSENAAVSGGFSENAAVSGGQGA